jgi:adenosylhomocysteine nucleosidase
MVSGAMERRRIGFVVGLKAEAALLRGGGFMVGIGGGAPAGAADAARRLVAGGATALVSFGLAGGLNPALRAGDILVPAKLVEDGAVYNCAPALLAWLGGPKAGPMLAGGEIAATVAQKSALFMTSQADAIDLESGAVARIAAAAGLPFAVLRAVTDVAGCDLPPAALVALDQAGAIGLARVIGAVLRGPGQIPAILQLARAAGQARRALQNQLRKLPVNGPDDPPPPAM